MSKCLILWPEVAKDSERLISAIKNGTLYNAEYCVNLAAMASVGIDTIFSCIDTSHVPDDNDLKLSRSSFVNGLRDARSAWTLLGFGCTSGAFDSRTMPLMDKYAQELNKGMDAFNRYRARYPEFK